MTALFHIGHVVTGYIKVLRPHAMDAKFTACLAHHRIHLFYAFPQQFRISWVTHGTFVTGSIGIESVEILHVRLPCLSQCLLLILYLQAAGQFQGIRMIFYVLLPMVIGPMLGNLSSASSSVHYTDEYGVTQSVPTAAMFLCAAAVAVLVFLPLAFLTKKGFRVSHDAEETV